MSPDDAGHAATRELLAERGRSHGEFLDQARIEQALSNVLRSELGWCRLDDDMRTAVTMILVKLARIHAGDPADPDHWADIAGYAELVAARLAALRAALSSQGEQE